MLIERSSHKWKPVEAIYFSATSGVSDLCQGCEYLEVRFDNRERACLLLASRDIDYGLEDDAQCPSLDKAGDQQ